MHDAYQVSIHWCALDYVQEIQQAFEDEKLLYDVMDEHKESAGLD